MSHDTVADRYHRNEELFRKVYRKVSTMVSNIVKHDRNITAEELRASIAEKGHSIGDISIRHLGPFTREISMVYDENRIKFCV